MSRPDPTAAAAAAAQSPAGAPAGTDPDQRADHHQAHHGAGAAPVSRTPPRVAVVTVSDRSAAGVREDRSGPVAVEVLTALGWSVEALRVVADGAESVRTAVADAVAQGVDVVLTLGGTGVGPRDRTPEGTRAVLELELPGVAEVIRARGLLSTPTAALSRAVAGTAGHSLVVNLPGSPAAVRESLEVLVPLVPHVLEQLRGGDH